MVQVHYWNHFPLNSAKLMTRPTTIAECGHRFCETCLKGYLGKTCICAVCKMTARIKNIRKSPLHSNLINWVLAMLQSVRDLKHVDSTDNNRSEASKATASNNEIICSGEQFMCPYDDQDDDFPSLEEAFRLTQLEPPKEKIDGQASELKRPPKVQIILVPTSKENSLSTRSLAKRRKNVKWRETTAHEENDLPEHLSGAGPKNKQRKSSPKNSVINETKCSQPNEPGSKNSSATPPYSKKGKSTKNNEYALKDLLDSNAISVGEKVSCFDCSAKVTRKGTLIDEIDLIEYEHPSDWATTVARLVKSPSSPKQNGWKVVKLGRTPLEDLKGGPRMTRSGDIRDKSLPKLGDNNRRACDFPLIKQPCERKICVSATCLGQDQMNFIKRASLSGELCFELDFSCELPSNVTHLIVDADSRRQCKRTLKYMLAILRKKTVVSFQWLLDSVESRKWLPEKVYTVNQDTQGRKAVNSTDSFLFEGLYFCCPKVKPSSLSCDDLTRLIRAGKGSIISMSSQSLMRPCMKASYGEEGPLDGSLIVIMDLNAANIAHFSRLKLPKLPKGCTCYSFRSSSWLLDCISHNSTNVADKMHPNK